MSKKGKKTRTPANSSVEEMRLNKFISTSGICSRRKADEFIRQGLVRVNDSIIYEMGHKVNPKKDKVFFKGKRVFGGKKVYILLNKPKGFITTTKDERNRKTVMDLVASATKERIYPVGRLDKDTTGLLLLTNDGELAQKLSHPSFEIDKIYRVELNKKVSIENINEIRSGITLDDGPVIVDDVQYADKQDKRIVGVQIHLGRNRIVRRIFEHFGYSVKKLDRVLYAGLTKKKLPRGKWRFLTEQEIIRLKHFL